MLQLLRHLPQLLGHGARHVLSGSGRQYLAARTEGGPRVPRGTLRPNHRRWRSGRHRRQDNSQLPPIRPCTMIVVKDLVLKKLTNKIIPDKDVLVEVGNTRRRLVTPGFKEQSQVHLIHAPRRQHI
jgi:hypothetical protein